MILNLVWELTLGVPFKLSKEVLLRLRDEVDRERLITEESIKARLQELQLMAQDGQLTEAEYDELEAKLIARLRAVREYQALKES